MSRHEATFRANPMQRRFIESRARADLFSSRMGEGKSAALCWAIFYHTRHNPGARWAIIRDTWENMQATTQKEFFKWFIPNVHGGYNASRKEFTWWLNEMGAGEVQFLGLDDPADASKLQSRELAGFAMDEPAPAAESGGIDQFVFDIAMSRLRQPNMNWYGVKLAENNPDEAHWTYTRFVRDPDPGFVIWQPETPENVTNLPSEYYQQLRRIWSHRPDLQRRFIDGKFGFQSIGRAVTPEYNEDLHIATGLVPVRGVPLTLLWDFGLNPTCIITQVTPMGHWLILEAYVGEEMGVVELVDSVIAPTLAQNYRGYTWSHTGDPQGTQREQSSSMTSAVKMLRQRLGGLWRPGPREILERVEPLRAVLRQTRNNTGLIRIDRHKAEPVHRALRGGWHYNVARTGLVSTVPSKDIHSHPGDAMGYGAATLFPMGQLQRKRGGSRQPARPTYFENSSGLGIGRPGAKVPKEAKVLRP